MKAVSPEHNLDELLAQTRHVKMTQAQQEAQRLSFVYGNCHLDNPRVTRELVAAADAGVRGANATKL